MNITLTYCNSLSFERIFAEIQSGTKKNHKTVKIWQSFGYCCDMFSTNQNLKWNPLKCTSLPSWHLQFELIYITENYPSCQKFVKNNHVKRASQNFQAATQVKTALQTCLDWKDKGYLKWRLASSNSLTSAENFHYIYWILKPGQVNLLLQKDVQR